MGQGFGHTRKPDVYTIDESLIQAGPYFNTKAGRKLVRDEAESVPVARSPSAQKNHE